jgi:hypothetical protein
MRKRLEMSISNTVLEKHLFLVKGPAADATDALQPEGLLFNHVMKMKMTFFF